MNATHQPRETEHVDFVRVLAKACLVTLFVSHQADSADHHGQLL